MEAYYPSGTAVANATTDTRAAFIRQTYGHLAGAILAFILIEAALFQTALPESMVGLLATSRYSCERAPWRTNNWAYHASNPAGYCTEEVERLDKAMETAFPFDAKIVPFREMMLVALRDLPYLPLYYDAEVAAVRSNVTGINRVPPKNRGRLAMSSYTWTIQ